MHQHLHFFFEYKLHFLFARYISRSAYLNSRRSQDVAVSRQGSLGGLFENVSAGC